MGLREGPGLILIGGFTHGDWSAAGIGTQAVRAAWRSQWRKGPGTQEEQRCVFKATDAKEYVMKSQSREEDRNGRNQVKLRDTFLSRVRKEEG